MKPKIAIIILNWNGWKDTIECLVSLYKITYPNYDVIVVDNGSEDDSVERIKEYAKGEIKAESKFFEYGPSNKPIKYIEYTREEAEVGGGKKDKIVDLSSIRKTILIKNEKNYGFAEGNNIAIRYVMRTLNPDYVLLMNNDTIVKEDFLDGLIGQASKYPDAGAIGPKMYFYDEPDKIWFAGGYIDWKYDGAHIGYGKLDNNKYDDNKYNTEKSVELRNVNKRRSRLMKDERREMLAATSELNHALSLVTGCCEVREMGYWAATQAKRLCPEINFVPEADVVHLTYTMSIRRGCTPEESDEGKTQVRLCERAQGILGANTPIGGGL